MKFSRNMKWRKGMHAIRLYTTIEHCSRFLMSHKICIGDANKISKGNYNFGFSDLGVH